MSSMLPPQQSDTTKDDPQAKVRASPDSPGTANSAIMAKPSKRRALSQAKSSNPTTSSTAVSTTLAKTENAPTIASTLSSDRIITLDEKYDLTLIAGRDDMSGRKAFRINRGALRMLSCAFQAMLGGQFSESTKQEIELPDDQCNAVHLVLKIAHLRLQDLPTHLNKTELVELAELCDKYDLSHIVRPFAQLHNWLAPHRGKRWYRSPDTQDWLFITYALKLESDYEFLSSLLSMYTVVEAKNDKLYYMCNGKAISLRQDLPDRILDKIRATRLETLQDILRCCNAALQEVLSTQKCTRAKSETCIALQVGALLKGYHALGLYPIVTEANWMHTSVCNYWQGIKDIGKNKDYNLCKLGMGGHYVGCTWDTCAAEKGLREAVRKVIQKKVHEDVWEYWKEEDYI